MSGRTPGVGPSLPGDAPASGPHLGADGDIDPQAPLPPCPAPLGKNLSDFEYSPLPVNSLDASYELNVFSLILMTVDIAVSH